MPVPYAVPPPKMAATVAQMPRCFGGQGAKLDLVNEALLRSLMSTKASNYAFISIPPLAF